MIIARATTSIMPRHHPPLRGVGSARPASYGCPGHPPCAPLVGAALRPDDSEPPFDLSPADENRPIRRGKSHGSLHRRRRTDRARPAWHDLHRLRNRPAPGPGGRGRSAMLRRRDGRRPRTAPPGRTHFAGATGRRHRHALGLTLYMTARPLELPGPHPPRHPASQHPCMKAATAANGQHPAWVPSRRPSAHGEASARVPLKARVTAVTGESRRHR